MNPLCVAERGENADPAAGEEVEEYPSLSAEGRVGMLEDGEGAFREGYIGVELSDWAD